MRFSSAGSSDADGDALAYSSDWATAVLDGGDPSHKYRTNGTYTATVTAKDATGRTGSASVQIVVATPHPRS